MSGSSSEVVRSGRCIEISWRRLWSLRNENSEMQTDKIIGTGDASDGEAAHEED